MKKLLLAGLATSALIAPAMAADMPVPAAPTVTWTGFYLGANAGWMQSTDGSVDSVGIPNLCTAVFDFACTGSVVPGNPPNTYGQASAQAATFSTPTSRNGGYLAGGQFGYNYQTTANTVVGLEADLQASGSNHTFTFTSVTPVNGFPGFPVGQTATLNTRLDFLGTVRARGGYLWDPSFLTYVTAGLAYAEIELSSTITQNVLGAPPGFGPYTGVGTTKVVRFGGTVGAGFEWLVVPNWSVKAEYLYVGLGQASPAVNSHLINPDPTGGSLSTVNVVTSSRFGENIVRGGVNYHF